MPPNDDKIDLLAIHCAGGRLRNEPSHACKQEQYGDPSKHIKLKGDSMRGTKQIETILRYELDNWLRWGRRRDWMPTSFRVPLGYLYQSRYPIDADQRLNSVRTDEIDAAQFERIVVGLPQQHRQAFVMHHLEKAAVAGFVVIIKGRDDRARVLGLQKSRYHEVVQQAHSMILRECVRLDPGLVEID